MESRYGAQQFTPAVREDYVRAAMDTDPVVLLEASWEYWTTGSQGFRPSPGQLREIAQGWVPEQHPYILLRDAVEAEVSPGLQALINRFGASKFAKAKQQRLPSHEAAWAAANREHRVFIFAKERMMERDAAPWNKSEAKGLHLDGAREALGLPAVKTEHASLALAEGLVNQTRLK
jgi:hypothetical protein